MAGSSNTDVNLEGSALLFPDEECIADPDDDFLVIQRATNAVSIIYNDLFSYSRSEFINYLSENYDIKELRYVRELVVSVVRRRLKQALGPLVERKSDANVKENLLKDIYNIYSLGEGSIQSLPKNMIKIDNKSQSQSVQTDSCLSNTIFASKLDLDTLRAELLNKITDIRHEVLKENHTTKPSSVSLQQSQPQQFIPSEPASHQQLGLLKTATDGTYNYHAVSASDNPRIISGEKAHGGVALLWKNSINDFVTPIKSIQSDRIVGIKCEFSGC